MALMRFPKVSSKSMRALAIEIRNEMSGGIAVDDTRFSLRQIESEIRHVHGEVQKQIDVANEILGILPDAKRVTSYPCLNLEDNNDFYCKCTKSGGAFKRVKLPDLYEWKGQSYIQYLGGTDLDLPFTPMRSMTEINAFGDVIRKPSYFIAGSYAYVALPKGYELMCNVTMLGIPADPTETNGKCFDVWNENWNVPEFVKSAIKERIRGSYANFMLTTAQSADLRNNAQAGNQVPQLLGQ